MLKLTITAHADKWPLITIVIVRESRSGQNATTEKIQYDLAYDKAEVMAHNQLRPMIQELINSRKGNVNRG